MRNGTSHARTMSGYYKLIFNANHPKVFPYLNQRGIDDAYLEIGRTQYQLVDSLFEDQADAYMDKRSANQDWKAVKKEAQDTLRDLLEAARLIGKRYPKEAELLNLHEPVPTRIDDWIKYAKRLYSKVLTKPDYLAECAKRNITEADIRAALAVVEQMPDLQREASASKGTAEQSTTDRNEELEKLAQYARELTDWAKVALKGKPQLLEILGIGVKSGTASAAPKATSGTAQ